MQPIGALLEAVLKQAGSRLTFFAVLFGITAYYKGPVENYRSKVKQELGECFKDPDIDEANTEAAMSKVVLAKNLCWYKSGAFWASILGSVTLILYYVIKQMRQTPAETPLDGVVGSPPLGISVETGILVISLTTWVLGAIYLCRLMLHLGANPSQKVSPNFCSRSE